MHLAKNHLFNVILLEKMADLAAFIYIYICIYTNFLARLLSDNILKDIYGIYFSNKMKVHVNI